MSEEIINQTATAMKRETNNNVNKDDTSTYGSLSEHKDTRTLDYDEIGEEFGFSDNDSQDENEKFQECDENDIRWNSNADNNHNDSDRLTVTTTATTATTTSTTTTNTATTASTTTTTTVLGCSNNLEDTERGTRLLTDNHSVPVEKTTDDVIVERVSKTEKKTKTKTNNESASGNPPATIDTDDDVDDYYSDEPEDELIVQFLGEANRIVCSLNK